MHCAKLSSANGDIANKMCFSEIKEHVCCLLCLQGDSTSSDSETDSISESDADSNIDDGELDSTSSVITAC